MPKREYELSVNEILGKKIVDLYGYVSTEFGSEVFKLTRAVCDDESTIGIEGEHDFPYLSANIPELSEENLQKQREHNGCAMSGLQAGGATDRLDHR